MLFFVIFCSYTGRRYYVLFSFTTELSKVSGACICYYFIVFDSIQVRLKIL